MWLFKKIYTWFYQREYRPNKYFRIPVYFIWLRYAIKAKHPFFFSAINPGIPGMWFLDDPKTETYKLLDKKYYPQSVEIKLPLSEKQIESIISLEKLLYPLIIKPDGDSVQGNNVYHITNQTDWDKYLKLLPKGNYLLQEYITGEEYSIYYYRYPTKKKWHILGITKKIYPTVIGDGKRNIKELIKNHERYHRYLNLFQEKYYIDMTEILPQWVSKQIATIGNHCKGSMFLDRSVHSSKELIHHIAQLFEFDAWIYLFRLDVKWISREDIVAGHFKVIESNNGVFAEPTYMYDPEYKIINAYKQIIKIWNHWYTIATYNHDIKKIPYIKSKEGLNFIKKFLKN